MKKTVITILTILTVYALLTACGTKKAAEAPDTAPSVTETAADRITEAVTAAPAETSAAEDAAKETAEETPETENAPETVKVTAPVEEIKINTDAAIEETVLYDEEGLKIIAKELTFSDYDMEIKLRIENSSEKALSVTSNTLGYSCNAVNGKMIEDGYIHAQLAPGKNSIETADFGLQELMISGITEIAEIELGFTISDEDYNYTYTGPLMLHTNLSEEHDPAADSYRKAINSGFFQEKYGYRVKSFIEEDLPSGDYVTVLSEAVINNKDGASSLFLELLNTSDEAVDAAISGIALNGLKVTFGNWDSVTILGGHTATLSVKLENVLEKEFAEVLGIREYTLFNADICVEKADDSLEELEEFPIEIRISDADASYDTSGDVVYDAEGIRVISKGFHEDPSGYSRTIHLLFIVENHRDNAIYFTHKYDSFSINDLMTDAILYSETVDPGESALMDLEVWESNFEDADIKGIDDIETAQFTAEIRDENYRLIESCELNF